MACAGTHTVAFFKAAVTPMPSTRTTAAFSAGSAPAPRLVPGSGGKGYIPHSPTGCASSHRPTGG
eukprot:4831671-Prymnesium_polylepis.1